MMVFYDIRDGCHCAYTLFVTFSVLGCPLNLLFSLMLVTHSWSVVWSSFPVICTGPFTMTFSFLVISTFLRQKTAVNPLSHICLTDNRDLYLRSGYIWARRACFGILCNLSMADADDFIFCPWGFQQIGWDHCCCSWIPEHLFNLCAEQSVSTTA